MSEKQKKLINIVSIIGIISTAFFLYWLYKQGYLSSQEKMQTWVNSLGIWGIIVFIIVQITQVVIPVIPGAITTVAGVIIFGPILGTLYNFIGIMIGSVILFFIVRHFGEPLVKSLLGERNYLRYTNFMQRHSNHFNIFFGFMMAFPVAPADALVMICALTPITFRKFFWICFFTKPISIACYSIGLKAILEFTNVIF